MTLCVLSKYFLQNPQFSDRKDQFHPQTQKLLDFAPYQQPYHEYGLSHHHEHNDVHLMFQYN